ncbi:MAG: FMN-binding protein [Treponema sp.]|jgi:uncharacterized protein with FMN-binding domain|nr:FMN-binding protein [Treponema sp.]
MKKTMRKTAPLAAMLLCACAGFGPGGGGALNTKGGAAYPPAVYEGTGRGFRGPVRVAVRLEAGGITDIRIVEHRDDQAVGGAAMEELLDQILLYNTADLDAVSGATESSEGFLEAVEDALAKAAP